MKRKDILLTRLQGATVIHSPKHFISYDHLAGDNEKPIKCMMTFWPVTNFFIDLKNSGIIKIENSHVTGIKRNWACMLILLPQFGYSNQKLEDILFDLFEKYEL